VRCVCVCVFTAYTKRTQRRILILYTLKIYTRRRVYNVTGHDIRRASQHNIIYFNDNNIILYGEKHPTRA